jgi:hypothetical protein
MPAVGGGEQGEKRTLGRCSRRWEVNLKIYVQEI